MALWKNLNNQIHDDMDGVALSYPNWPQQGMVKITQQEADVLLAPTAEQLLEQKTDVLKTFISLRATIVNVLSAIAGRMERAGDMSSALACDAAATSFINIENTAEFIAATDAPTAQAVIITAYKTIAATLAKSSPISAAQFEAMGFSYL
jgi:hypothetical protein